MPRRVKLDFKPLTLSETAKRLGVPHARARKILALVGVDFSGRTTGSGLTKKARNSKASSRRAKTTVRQNIQR